MLELQAENTDATGKSRWCTKVSRWVMLTPEDMDIACAGASRLPTWRVFRQVAQ